MDAFVLLIENGADPNMKGKCGNTALHWVAAFGSLEMAKILIDSGADINAISKTRHTAFEYASKYHNAYIAKLLVECGAAITIDSMQYVYKILEYSVDTDLEDVANFFKKYIADHSYGSRYDPDG